MTSPDAPDESVTAAAVPPIEPSDTEQDQPGETASDAPPEGTSEPVAEPLAPVAEPPAAALPEPVVLKIQGPPDVVLAAAVELARTAAVAVGGESVGEHSGARAETDRVVTHAFAATLPGYVGWYWAVTVARPPRSRTPTVDEVVLLPGETALLAPTWVPWDERVRPGDLSPGDLLPPAADDPRLVPAYVLSDDPAVEIVAFELGLGREQVMSRDGRLLAADRWQAGDRGPDAPMARQAPAHCGTCGFFLALAGSLQAGFGVCGNEVTDSDGQVVSIEYGCGAHSQTKSDGGPHGDVADVVYDDGEEVTANSS